MEAFEPEVDIIPYHNLEDLEETPEQSQDTELIHEEVQQEEDVVTQEPTSSNTLVEVATQMEAIEPEVDIIPDRNLEDLEATPEQSQDT